ncbi:hypothetical protein F5Y11DRAFT_366836 [Daldinia sp. FL1419]|nr:hypothetical protein F5Y11DRAFT_366836 [Daldinia sp. FL1419]
MSDSNGSMYSHVGSGEVTVAADAFRTYFSRDPRNRFELDQVMGNGVNGILWAVNYNPTPEQDQHPRTTTKKILLKVNRDRAEWAQWDMQPEGAREEWGSLEMERSMLKVFQRARHSVTVIEPENDPLAQTYPDIPPHPFFPDRWLYLEYLPNGTLERFSRRASRYMQGRKLPNRMLWSFFLCFARMCVSMAYPPPPGPGEQLDETVPPNTRPRKIVHGDMHHGNVMLGDVFDPSDLEHALTPMLKMIDFGCAREYEDEEPRDYRNEERQNIFDIGLLMVELMSLDTAIQDLADLEEEDTAFLRVGPKLDRVIAVAPAFMCPGADATNEADLGLLDRDLIRIVLLCTAMDARFRPTSEQLFRVVSAKVAERTYEWYAAKDHRHTFEENDEHIRNIIQVVVLDADVD